MKAAETIEVPARSGKAVKLQAGWSVKLINTLGSQVVDTWAFNAKDLGEHMSITGLEPIALSLAICAMAAATIALGRDEGAYEEKLEAQVALRPASTLTD